MCQRRCCNPHPIFIIFPFPCCLTPDGSDKLCWESSWGGRPSHSLWLCEYADLSIHLSVWADTFISGARLLRRTEKYDRVRSSGGRHEVQHYLLTWLTGSNHLPQWFIMHLYLTTFILDVSHKHHKSKYQVYSLVFTLLLLFFYTLCPGKRNMH